MGRIVVEREWHSGLSLRNRLDSKRRYAALYHKNAARDLTSRAALVGRAGQSYGTLTVKSSFEAVPLASITVRRMV